MSTPVTIAPAPPAVDRLQRGAMLVGGAAGVLVVVGAFLAPAAFVGGWLFAFLFWVGISIGCLSLALIHNLTGGMWGHAIRRLLEAGTRTLPWMALAFVPIAVGLPAVYYWARPEAMADHVLRQKAPYLNRGFFIARTALYFALWTAVVVFLNRWSARLDLGSDRRASRRLRGLGGVGLLLLGLTITFSSVDWAMSLDAHWFSTVYGILFMVGQVLSALAFVVVVIALIGQEEPLVRVADRTVVHDLGKLMLAFVMLWGYITFSQFLIIWSANLPEEIPWYLRRAQGGWQWLALGLVLFQFVVPFLLLLSRGLKRDARRLGALALALAGARLLDLFWLVGPDLQGHGGAGHGLAVLLLGAASVVALGGAWLWLFASELKRRPLLVLGEPEIRERLLVQHG